MATFVLTRPDVFVSGTVAAYVKPALGVPASGAPSGSAVSSPSVSGNSVTFTGLADNTQYIAYQGSPDRYVSFSTPAAAAGGGAPSGAAGGVLGGTYPNPSFAADMATQAELDAVSALIPDTFEIPVMGTPAAQTNWSTYAVSTSSYRNQTVQSSGAQNAEITWNFNAHAGTYDLAILWRGSTNFGIITFRIDGASVGTLDEYQASGTTARTVISPLTLAVGAHVMNLKVESKNASSSSFFGMVSGLIFTRTGA